MGASQALSSRHRRHEEIEITDAAIRSYSRFLAVFGTKFRTHGCADGGLICEDRGSRARPTMWRILPDGGVLPDRRYNYVDRAFMTCAVPEGV